MQCRLEKRGEQAACQSRPAPTASPVCLAWHPPGAAAAGDKGPFGVRSQFFEYVQQNLPFRCLILSSSGLGFLFLVYPLPRAVPAAAEGWRVRG